MTPKHLMDPGVSFPTFDGQDEPELPDFKLREPTDQELNDELKALGLEVGREEEELPPSFDAGAIRTDIDLADFNVENLQLCDDDYNDPELLAQLASMERTFTVQTQVKEDPAATANAIEPSQMSLEELCRSALAAKRSGDMDRARLFMSQLMVLQSEASKSIHPSSSPSPNPSSSPSPNPSPNPRPNPTPNPSSNPSPNPSPSPSPLPFSQPSHTASPSSSLASIGSSTNLVAGLNRPLIRTLQKQAKECQAAAQLFMEFDHCADASDFTRREKAFEADVLAIERKWAPAGVPVEVCEAPVMLPVDCLDRTVPAGSLTMTIGQLRVLNRSVVAGGGKESFFFKVATIFDPPIKYKSDPVTYERLRLGEIKFSFTHYPTMNNQPAGIILSFYKLKPGIFTANRELLSTVTIDLRGLTEERRIKPSIVMPTKDAGTPLIQFVCDIRIRRPWRNDPVVPRTEARWTVCVKGETGRIFLPPSSQPPPVDKVKEAEAYIAPIDSFAVLEHEAMLLRADPTSSTDPLLLARLTALEGKADALKVAVHLGQLSMEQYLTRVEAALVTAKRRAIEAKKSGDLPLARRWIQHVMMMEEEIKEANEEEPEEPPEDQDREP